MLGFLRWTRCFITPKNLLQVINIFDFPLSISKTRIFRENFLCQSYFLLLNFDWLSFNSPSCYKSDVRVWISSARCGRLCQSLGPPVVGSNVDPKIVSNNVQRKTNHQQFFRNGNWKESEFQETLDHNTLEEYEFQKNSIFLNWNPYVLLLTSLLGELIPLN